MKQSNCLTPTFLSSIIICAVCFFKPAFSQHFSRIDTIPVKKAGNWLKMPWLGGHNFCQFSDIDINLDGIKDLFVFDRTGNKITTYINKGTAGVVDYLDSTSKYAKKFPHLESWVLLRDYNCDGKADIFSYDAGGIKVWKNISSGGNLMFAPVSPNLQSTYCPGLLNLAITPTDIPTIDDIDGDGDLDILTYDGGGINMQYHINQSKESGHGCDSLTFHMDCTSCWGNYRASISGCNMVIGTCRIKNPNSSQQRDADEEPTDHAGNCSLCMDIDGDGDKDILLGQLGCDNMTLLTNGGDKTNANMTSMDDSFPSYNIPAMLSSFPCGYYLDLNNDNKRDLLVSPNAPNISVDNESIWYYLNTGTDNAPIFSRQTRSFLQNDMIDVGEGADPVFFDFDNDGLTDLLISNYKSAHDSVPPTLSYDILAFKNIGTSTSPKFDLVSSDYANTSIQLPSIMSKHLTFGDIDGDGDPDMFIGDYDGNLHYFKNTASTGQPCNFVLTTQGVKDNTGTLIDIGNYAAPQLIDADRDGDLDLIIGERSGNLNYYENIGNPAISSFKFITDSFGGVDVLKWNITGYSVPFMYDSAGSYRMIVGSEANRSYSYPMGWIWFFKNIDGNLAGKFSLVDSVYHNIWEGTRMILNGKDINNDGLMDLVIGNYTGGIALYMGDTTTTSVEELHEQTINFSIYPNPSTGEINIYIPELNRHDKLEINIYNSLGEIIEKQYITSINTKIEKHLPPGIYSCQVSTTAFSKTQKLAVFR